MADGWTLERRQRQADAIAKADMMMKGENPENIYQGGE